LRMLDCGGNTAYNLIFDELDHTYKSVLLTKTIILQTEGEAQKSLSDAGISQEASEKILGHTHCEPPEAYFITSQDMVGKAAVWAHFGSWDFAKAHTVNIVKNYEKEKALLIMQQELSISEPEAQQLYNEATAYDPNTWISPWPSYISMPGSCWMEQELLVCSAGFYVNTTTTETFIPVDSGVQYPNALMYIDPEGYFKTKYFADYGEILNSNGRLYSAAIVPSGENINGFLMDELLLESMFTRLFFYQGHNLECFELFDHQSTVTQEQIYVWKLDWSCADPYVVYSNE
jgi:hypothetical protein